MAVNGARPAVGTCNFVGQDLPLGILSRRSVSRIDSGHRTIFTLEKDEEVKPILPLAFALSSLESIDKQNSTSSLTAPLANNCHPA